MKAWLVKQWCGPEGLEWAETPTPEPKEGQVLIRVAAAALNFLDTLMIQGRYQVKPPLPFTPGVEISGTVERAGAGTDFRPGERVCALLDWGGFAECALAQAGDLIRLPDGVDLVGGAVMPVVYPTAYRALKQRAQLRAGEWVLVHAGAGGVGLAAIQLAKAWGAKVIATAGSAKKVAVCREQGADWALDYSDAGWVEEVKTLTEGRGVNVIVDPVGGDVTDLSMKCLAWEGRIVIVGFASGRIPQIPANRLLLKCAAAMGVSTGDTRAKQQEITRGIFQDLFAMLQKGQIRPLVSRRYPMTEAPQALKDLASRETVGKVVLV